jgi:hypothetical protein
MNAKDGQFVWYELLTTDTEAARAFYTETIGWKTMPFEGGDKPYTMWAVGEQPIGGVMTLPDEARAMGVPPNWLAHVKVADADATIARVKELGGSVLKPPETIPTVGRFAVIADPQGAVISVFTPENDMAIHDGAPRQGDISWHELNSTDWEAGAKFYEALFGWETVEDMDMGPEGVYHLYKTAGAAAPCGGMSNMAKAHGFPASWLYYISVDDLDATVERIKGNGGAVVNGPMDVPGGKIAQCTDPQGAMFAVHWADPNATGPT